MSSQAPHAKSQKAVVRTSKFLSFVLRHKPGAIGLELDEAGWADVSRLIDCAKSDGRSLSEEQIRIVVETNDKQRFEMSEDGRRIRASQGHSIDVNLGLEPQTPPDVLFHGTATRFLDSILATGLEPRGRRHVHLSADEATAVAVGQRHGKPVVLQIDAASMAADGHCFYLSKNRVWLAEAVPADYLEAVTSVS